jgi:hypothetical protein
MSTLFQDYLGHNLLDIVARSTVFEDYVLTKEDVQQVVKLWMTVEVLQLKLVGLVWMML